MLKITTEIHPGIVVFILEGTLSGPWVHELEHTWQTALSEQRFDRARFDLSGLTFVSSEGKELLQRLFASGAELVSSDVLTKSMVEEISQKRANTKDISRKKRLSERGKRKVNGSGESE